MKQPVLTFTVGVPGSGKSTLARQLIGEGSVQISKDELRTQLFGSKHRYWRLWEENRMSVEPVLEAAFHHLIDGLMSVRSDIVLSNTNLRWCDVEKPLEFANSHGYRVRAIVLPRSLDELLKRNEMRPGEDWLRPQDIRLYHDRFEDPEAWWRHFPGVEVLFR
jgi:predicted kinase